MKAITRRFAITLAAGLSALALVNGAFAQSAPSSDGSYDRAEVEKTFEIGEFRTGDTDAKVTIVEYVSLTCGACATYHNNYSEQVKEAYVDTGKVEFVTRFFLRNRVDAAVSALTQCAGDKSLDFAARLLEDQASWLQAESPVSVLQQISTDFGMDKAAFEACLADKDMVQKIIEVTDHAQDKLKVGSTPTFFINGEKYPGVLSTEQISALVDPLLNN